eukprot:390075-Amorphochlora_amoeboformis.AAC.2
MDDFAESNPLASNTPTFSPRVESAPILPNFFDFLFLWDKKIGCGLRSQGGGPESSLDSRGLFIGRNLAKFITRVNAWIPLGSEFEKTARGWLDNLLKYFLFLT